jgi:hypothetical protein
MGRLLVPQQIKKRYIPKSVKHEESLQRQVCRYLRLKYPEAVFRSDYASGLHLTENQGRIHKSLQSGRAWPDLFIYNPTVHNTKHYCGLAIELKKEGTSVILKTGPRKGKLSTNPHIQEQAAVLKQLIHLGYYANFAVGIDEAMKIIDWYFQRKTPQNGELF